MAFKEYGNKSGLSGVSAYEFDDESIRVEFSSGGIYTYNYAVTGKTHVENMKNHAAKGTMLQSYINKHQPKYAEKA